MVPAEMPASKVVVREVKDVEELAALALSFGLILSPIADFKKEFALSVATRLRPREGKFVYQSAAYSLPAFSRTAAEQIFAAELITTSSAAVVPYPCASATEG